jgi:hypothetical protein
LAIKHYVDEIPPSTGRVYRIETSGNSSKIIDETAYQQVGTGFGAMDVNTACVLECNYSKNGTVHQLTTPNAMSENIKFFATDSFVKGDTFTFNGTSVVVQTMDGQALGTGFFKANSIVECSRHGNVLYFTSGSKNITDDVTSVPYRIGIDNGKLYIEEA